LLLATGILDIEQHGWLFILWPKNSKRWANINQFFHVSFYLNLTLFTLKRIGDNYELALILTFLIFTTPQLLLSNSMHLEETINDDIYSNYYKKKLIYIKSDFSSKLFLMFFYIIPRDIWFIFNSDKLQWIKNKCWRIISKHIIVKYAARRRIGQS
jgi:hypothetical protein